MAKRKGLHENVKRRIRELHKIGYSRAKIEKVLGLSRRTILEVLPTGREKFASRYSPDLDKPPGRCSGCGQLVYFPCLFCSLVEDGLAVQRDDVSGNVIRRGGSGVLGLTRPGDSFTLKNRGLGSD